MRFDVVVGNPPYNDDVYLDFIEHSYNLSSKYTVLITPLKFYSLRTKNYKERWGSLFSHMKSVVYYPIEDNVFPIVMTCGVGYFLMDKDAHNTTLVKNVSSVECLNADFTEVVKDVESFNVNSLFALNLGKSFKIEDTYKDGKYKVFNRGIIMTTSHGGAFSKTDGTVSDDAFIISTTEISQSTLKTTLKVIFSSDDLIEAESFASFVNTRFVRFLIWLGNCNYSNAFTNKVWRFVPDVGAFDHIFTDAELYARFNLSKEQIDFIESLIRSRI